MNRNRIPKQMKNYRTSGRRSLGISNKRWDKTIMGQEQEEEYFCPVPALAFGNKLGFAYKVSYI